MYLRKKIKNQIFIFKKEVKNDRRRKARGNTRRKEIIKNKNGTKKFI